jgi:hypothetical protein
MNAPSIDIVAMLEDESVLGLTFTENLFIGKEPAKPDDCVIVFDTGGLPPQLTLGDQGYEFPSVNIRVRSRDYQTGWNLIDDIKTLLHGRAHETWNDTLYTVIYCASGPVHLDWDENSRARFVVNFDMQRRESDES